MGIKNFFKEDKLANSAAGNTAIPMTSLSGVAVSSSVESPRFIRAKKESHQRFIPQVDFSKPENFAVYGSAAEYYKSAVRHVYASYPYDGSAAEKEEWHNSSSYWENYIFENEYPRTNGFANLSPTGWGGGSGSSVWGYRLSDRVEYIKIYGGPNTSIRKPGDSITGSIEPGTFKDGFANIFDEGSNRGSNLQFGHAAGNTIEFWMNKRAHSSGGGNGNNREVLLDVWNNVDYSSDPSNYGRLTLEFTTGSSVGDTQSPMELTMISGTYGFTRQPIGTSLRKSTVYGTGWHHYAVTMKTGSSGMKVEVYVDGVYESSHALGTKITSSVGMPHLAYIGSLMTRPSGATSMQHVGGTGEAEGSGWGKFSGSLDEFRFWKRARTAQDIGRFWYTPVHGATSKDRSTPADLGVYYKFNEGITGDRTLDSIALDYSGRISNGDWIVTGSSGAGFLGAESRNTGSAIVLAGASTSEFKDPILRPNHTSVQAYLTASAYSASFHDDQNGNMIYHQLPSWITEEDLAGGQDLKKICQIMASYLDSVNLQIKTLPKIRHISYSEDVSGSKPYPFMKGMLYGMGFDAPDLFTETTALQQYMDRDEKLLYEDKLNDIKNLIYRNIYNNLTYIYKTKGTEKGLRNLLRCFGIDDEIYKLNFYGKNVTYDLKTKYRNVTAKKNYVNFYESTWPYPSSNQRDQAVVYMYGNPIPGVQQNSGLGMTFECETKFPYRIPVDENTFVSFGALSSSIFGLGMVTADDGYTLQKHFFSTYAVKQAADMGVNAEDSKDAKFYCKLWNGQILTSSIYKGVYNNESWHFSVKVEPVKQAGMVTSSYKNQTGLATFTGINTVGDQIINNFSLTSSITGDQLREFQQAKKRPYFGALRDNLTGTLELRSDVRVGSVRSWLDVLSQEELEAHAKDVTNFGRSQPVRNSFLTQTSASQAYIPKIDTLVHNWDFSSVSNAGEYGYFTVPDISNSGSRDWYGGTDVLYGTASLDGVLNRRFSGMGYGFRPYKSPVDRDYELSAKHQLPEVVNSSDQVKILEQDDIHFTKTKRPTNTIALLEKSMYQIVSEDMINMFAGITEFNNLIGAPIHKYRQEYKGLGLLRRIYFDKVGNTPDVDKFINYYKWMDDSVTQVLRQILPMSADISENVSNVIESHVLERNKYWHKYPSIEFKQDDPEGSIRGINELRYPWKYGHAPVAEENFYSTQQMKIDEDFAGPSSVGWSDTGLVGMGSGWQKNSSSMPVRKYGDSAGDVKNNNPMFFIRGDYGSSAGGYLKTTGKIFGPFVLTSRIGSWYEANAVYFSGSYSTGTKVGVDRAEEGDKLTIQWSTDGVSWTEFPHGKKLWTNYGSGPGDVPYDPIGQWLHITASYTGTEGVYIRFDQAASNTDNAWDHFLIDNIRIRGIDHAYWSKFRKVRTDGTGSTVNTQRETIRQILTTQTTGSAPLLSSSEYTSYRGGTFALRNFSKPQRLVVDAPEVPIGSRNDEERELGLPSKFKISSNPSQIFGFHRGVLKSDDDTSFIEIDYHQDDSWRVFEKTPTDLQPTEKRINTRARVYRNGVHKTGSYDSIKSMAALPFTVYSSSVTTGYVSAYRVENTSSLDFNNLHQDNSGYDPRQGSSLQGPFTEKYVGGLQYRHAPVNYSSSTKVLDSRYDRGEGWYITTPGTDGLDFHEILSQSWDNGTTGWTMDTPWTQWSGSTPTSGTGPSEAQDGTAAASHGTGAGKYIYVDTIASGGSGLGSTVYLYTPLVATADAATAGSSLFTGSFYYHMHGQDCGKLSLQYQIVDYGGSLDVSGSWEDISVRWNGSPSTHVFGEQHAAPNTAWSKAWFDLSSFIQDGKDAFLRWKYEPGPTILGEVALDKIRITGYDIADFRLFNGDYSNSREFSNTKYYRDEVSKRPVNIKNIRQRTGSTPTLLGGEEQTRNSTIIGNYSQPYEVVQTSDRSVNNKFFRKNVLDASLTLGRGGGSNAFKNFLTSSFVRSGKITRRESPTSSSFHFDMGADVWKANAQTTGSHQSHLSQRTGSSVYGTAVGPGNSASLSKTIFAERFSSPGDWLTMGRGRLDPTSEQFSPNNATPWRNIHERNSHQKELTRHTSKGGFGNEGLKWAGYLESEYPHGGDDTTNSYRAWKLNASASQTLNGQANSTSSYDFEDHDWDADATRRTYSFWYKGDNEYLSASYDQAKPRTANEMCFFSKGNGFSLQASGQDLKVVWAGLATTFTDAAFSLFDGKWHHIAITLYGDTSTSKLYVGSWLDGETWLENHSNNTAGWFGHIGTGSGYSANLSHNGTPFVIGGVGATDRSYATKAAHGHFAEFAIYGKVLSQSMVAEVYNDGKGINLFKQRNATDLLHYYRFEDDTPVLKDWVAEKKGVRRGHGAKMGSGQSAQSRAIAGIPVSASTHKNPRNTSYSVKYRHATSSVTNEYENYSIETDYDNANITSLIPRSDAQYSWIRYSTNRDPEWAGGYAVWAHNSTLNHPQQGFDMVGVLGYATSSTDIIFLSQSHIIGHNSASQPQDFVGMNTLLVDPISGMTNDPAQNLLGHSTPTLNGTSSYANIGFFPSSPYDRSRITGSLALNALLLKRNGPYNWPTWKQIRGNEHPISRYQRYNNKIDFVVEWRDKVLASGPHPKMKENIKIVPFSESAVVGRYRPVSHLFEVGESRDRVALRSSYANNLCTFTNYALNSYLGFEKNEQQIHDQLYELYSDLRNKPDSPIKAFVKMKYKEVVFPAERNMYRGQMRSRKEFTQKAELRDSALEGGNYRTFWRDSPTNRVRSLNFDEPVLDKFGRSVFISGAHSFRDRLSVWNMDVAENAVGSRLSGAEGGAYLPSLAVGQLVDPACIQTQNLNTDGGKFPSYLRVQDFTGTLQCMAYVNAVQKHLGSNPRIAYGLRPTTLFAQAEFNSVVANKFSWHTPMRDEYDDWASDLKPLGQSYSIIPEYKVSENIDYYVRDAGGNFFQENAREYTLEGASEYSASAIHEQSSSIAEFFKDYSNSDFMKYFDVFRDSHAGIGEVDTYSITCRGIKKLLPYNGFYPQDRVLQLAQIFSSSIAATTGSLGGDTSWSSPTQPGRSGFYKKLNSVAMPLFAPGVFFNSMKSGVAVDFPVYSGSTAARTTQYFSTKPSYRIPFEAGVDMVRHFPKLGGFDHRFGTDNTIMNHNLTGATKHFGGWTGIIDPRYEMAAHNFMGEIPRFFLRTGGVSTFASQKAQDQKPMMSGSTYYMDVCLYKTADMVTTEGPRKSTDGEGVRGIVYGPCLSGALSQSMAAVIGPNGAAEEFPVIGYRAGTSINQKSRTDPNYCAWTPPYFYGKSIARISFKPHKASVMDSGSSQVFEMHEILAHADVQYMNENPLKQNSEGDRAEASYDDLLSASWMPITASINLFDQVKLPLLDLDPITRQPMRIRQNSFEGQDVWKISTKWECPILDHSLGDRHSGSLTTIPVRSGLTSSITIDRQSCRALWNTYGSVPTGSKGLWFSIEDSYPTKVLRTGLRNRRTKVTGSLIEFVGMQTGKQRVGELAYQKEIEEAVVAIPYLLMPDVAQDPVLKKRMVWDQNTFRYFFGVDKSKAYLQMVHKENTGKALPEGMLFPGSPAADSTSITDMYEKMDKYVFPPSLDFKKNKDKDPFVMYIFEFSSVLTREDLSHMWQGIAPDLSKRSELQETTVSHKNSVHEFFGGGRIPSNIRWMVFKVKKRAETNYYNVRVGPSKKLDEDVMKFNFGIGRKEPEYTYNWPYDFCSLVELVQLEPEIVIKGDETSGE